MPKSAAQPSLFDDALNPPAAAPLAQPHEPRPASSYSAKDIEVLEGLEPVRKRPGMYIGGTDEKSLHHLFAEILDNSMDEVVNGHGKLIEVTLAADGSLTVRDDGRGMPVDPHAKYTELSGVEVIMTMLHAGGKFSGKAYETAGGLHGVGASVVNALSERVEVTVWKDGAEWRQTFSRGKPTSKLQQLGATRRHGTQVSFSPDPVIFGDDVAFKPARLLRMTRAKAYLYRGVEIRWRCAPERISDATPAEAVFHFPNGLADYLAETAEGLTTVTPEPFFGRIERQGEAGAVEWAITWTPDGFGQADGFIQSYCNTIPTPEGGTHEAGLRAALTRGLKAHAELSNEKRGALITADDVMAEAGAMLSVFVRNPEFQGQTKERLSSLDAQRLVEAALRDPFDHWLAGQPKAAGALLAFVIERAEERLKRRKDREVARASATRKLRLPGKLADCSANSAEGAEIFIVEGDSAGGSAKQARDRRTQAILPLRGKILNVASASVDQLRGNKELADLSLALGVETGARYRDEALRYERVIIMTDADVDGDHIASLLITFFYRTMPDLIRDGKLYLALPPLYRLSHGGTAVYARDDAHKDELMATTFKGKKPEIGRFKGLGEMMPAQLKETTMDPKTRSLARVQLTRAEGTDADLVETLMGKRPELRFRFIQENAEFAVEDLDI
ncbi:MAG TPA: DNA topoisomerase IV subunit B [Caulobacteraceae bacterium]|jgi:topoisomerase-4 subunit B